MAPERGKIGRLREAIKILIHPDTHPEIKKNLFQAQAEKIKNRITDQRVSEARDEVATYYKWLSRIEKYGNHLPDWMKVDHTGTIMVHPGTPTGYGYKISETGGIRKVASLFGYEPDDGEYLKGEEYVRASDEIISFWLPRPKSSE